MATKAKRGEKGNSGKEPKLHQVTEWRKKPWENPGSVRGPVLLWPRKQTVYDYELGSIMSGVRCDQNFHDIYPVHLVGVGSSGR